MTGDGPPPNFVIILADDIAPQDLGSYGSRDIATPSIDELARHGVTFRNFYGQTECAAARASLLTGCYPPRIAELFNRKNSPLILHPEEATIGTLLKPLGYSSAWYGKWQLGGERLERHDKQLISPLRFGFDSWLGEDYQTPDHESVHFENNAPANSPIAEDAIIASLTAEAIRMIMQERSEPFCIVLSHGSHQAPSVSFSGKSGHGPYADSIAEIDWSTGRILAALRESNCIDNTWIFFVGDNGPDSARRDTSLEALQLRGGRGSTWEGGTRIPAIVSGPGMTERNVISETPAGLIDLLPTIAQIASTPLTDPLAIDGRPLLDILLNKAPSLPVHEALYYYSHTHLQAVRCGNWKLVLDRPADTPWIPAPTGQPADPVETPLLFNLDRNPEETHDVFHHYQEIALEMMIHIERAREIHGDYHTVGRLARFLDEGVIRPDLNSWKYDGLRNTGA